MYRKRSGREPAKPKSGTLETGAEMLLMKGDFMIRFFRLYFIMEFPCGTAC